MKFAVLALLATSASATETVEDAAAAVAKIGIIVAGAKCSSTGDGNGCIVGHRCGKVVETTKADLKEGADKAADDGKKETEAAGDEKKKEEGAEKKEEGAEKKEEGAEGEKKRTY